MRLPSASAAQLLLLLVVAASWLGRSVSERWWSEPEQRPQLLQLVTEFAGNAASVGDCEEAERHVALVLKPSAGDERLRCRAAVRAAATAGGNVSCRLRKLSGSGGTVSQLLCGGCAQAAESTVRVDCDPAGLSAAVALRRERLVRHSCRGNFTQLLLQRNASGACELFRRLLLPRRGADDDVDAGCFGLMLASLSQLLPLAASCEESLNCAWVAMQGLTRQLRRQREGSTAAWAQQLRAAAAAFASAMRQRRRLRQFANASLAFSLVSFSGDGYGEVRVHADEAAISELECRGCDGHGGFIGDDNDNDDDNDDAGDFVVARLPLRASRQWAVMTCTTDLLFAAEHPRSLPSARSFRNFSIGSFVLDLKSGGGGRLPEPLFLHFRKRRRSLQLQLGGWRPHCVFWDEAARLWSDAGCSLVNDTELWATCRCEHLTAFSVLFSPAAEADRPQQQQQQQHRHLLSYLTYGAGAASTVCLAFIVATYAVFLRRPQPPARDLTGSKLVLTANVALAVQFVLYFANVLLAGRAQWLCQLLGACLHAAVLAACACTNGISAHMFASIAVPILLDRLPAPGRRSFVPATVAVAVSLPACVVASAVGVSVGLWREPAYRCYGTAAACRVCWLRQRLIICCFLLPLLASVAVNLLLAGASVAAVASRPSAGGSARAPTGLADRLLQVLGLSCLLGLTWILGICLFLGSAAGDPQLRLVLEYVFVVTNCSQGLFIFLFFFVGRREVMGVWLQCLGGRGRGGGSKYGVSAGSS